MSDAFTWKHGTEYWPNTLSCPILGNSVRSPDGSARDGCGRTTTESRSLDDAVTALNPIERVSRKTSSVFVPER